VRDCALDFKQPARIMAAPLWFACPCDRAPAHLLFVNPERTRAPLRAGTDGVRIAAVPRRLVARFSKELALSS
jgi:hypothetical protein